jgi:hypothetical protein
MLDVEGVLTNVSMTALPTSLAKFIPFHMLATVVPLFGSWI